MNLRHQIKARLEANQYGGDLTVLLLALPLEMFEDHPPPTEGRGLEDWWHEIANQHPVLDNLDRLSKDCWFDFIVSRKLLVMSVLTWHRENHPNPVERQHWRKMLRAMTAAAGLPGVKVLKAARFEDYLDTEHSTWGIHP